MNKNILKFLLVVSLVVSSFVFTSTRNNVSAQTCNPTFSALKIVDCRKVDVSAYEGYCVQITAREDVSCGSTCQATYPIGNCSTWATGCQWQRDANYNTHNCGGPTPTTGARPTNQITATPRPTSQVTITPTSTLIAQCQNILAYNNNWVLMTNTQLTQTRAGQQLYYCTTGYSTSGSFDMARFRINGTLMANTTLRRPGTTADFCQSYTVPNNVYNFTVVGEMHHSIRGWVI